MKSVIVAISGASGSVYGLRLVEELVKSSDNIYLCVSSQSFYIITMETGINWAGKTEAETEKSENLKISINIV